MKRALIAVVAMFIVLLPITSAAEIRYFSFENFAVVNADVGASKTFSTDLYLNTWYLIGSAVVTHDPRLGKLQVNVTYTSAGIAFGAKTYAVITTNAGETYTTPIQSFSASSIDSGTVVITVEKAFSGNSVQVDLYVQFTWTNWDDSYPGDNHITITFDSLRGYYLNDDHQGIISSLTSYTPVDGVLGQALKLDSTEILMNPVNLSSGTLTFNVKWDGTQTTILKDGSTATLWIDSTGKVNIKNEDGTTFTSNSSLTQGVWQKVTIAFQTDTLAGGYIAIDSNQTSIDWSGNFIADRIGDSTLSTSTLIDELHIYNEYMNLDEVTTGVVRYILKKADGNTIVVSPEGGQELGNVSLVALDSVGNQLLSTVLTLNNKQVNLPNNTVKVVLSRENVQRTYLINRVNNIVFPATGTTIAVLNVQVNPGTWEYMTVKTVDGKVAADVDMSNNMAGFTALVGHQYLFSFQSGNVTRVRTYTVTGSGDIVFYIQDLDTAITPPLDVQAWYEDGLVVVSYYDEQLSTNYLNVTLTGYENFEKAWEVHDERDGSWGLYVIKANANNTDYVDVTIVANVSGEIKTFKRVVYVEGSGESTKAPFPTSLVPPALLFLLTALVGIFVFNEPALMLLGGAGSLTLLALMGWIPPAPGLVAVLSLLGVLGLIIYRRG